MADPSLNHWDIRPDETARAYAAFATYRDMGPERSLEKAAKKLSKSSRVLAEWSGKFGWVERARAFDEQTAKMAADRAVVTHAEVRARQAQQARRMAEKGMQKIEATDPDDLSHVEATSMAKTGWQEERAALGIPATFDVTTGGQALIPTVFRPATDDEPGGE